MVVAIYRIYYGSDWIRYGIRSIIDQVDKVVVFYNNSPWSMIKEVTYKGEVIPVPPFSPDGSDKLVKSIRHEKLMVIEDDFTQQANQSNYHVKKVQEILGEVDYVIIPQADHVEYGDIVSKVLPTLATCKVVSTRPVDIWKYPHLRLPQRLDRICTTFWNLKACGGELGVKDTAECRHGDWGLQFIGYTFNMHFASHPYTMWWRCMLRQAQAPHIGDDQVIEGWYDKWLNWQEGSSDTELGWCKGEPTLGIPYGVDMIPPEAIKSVVIDSLKWRSI